MLAAPPSKEAIMQNRRTMCAALLAIGGALPAAALSATPAHPQAVANFTCENGQSLRVLFYSNSATVLAKARKAVSLPQLIVADGILYGTSAYKLRGKGNGVTWTAARSKATSCQAVH